MTLREACDLGYACGLETVNDAVLNVEIHCTNLFSYDDITLELYELHEEAKPHLSKSILSVFPDLEEKYNERQGI